MDAKSLTTLELPKVLERLASQAAFSASKDLARSLEPTADLAIARRRQAETTEAARLLSIHSSLSIGGAHDVRPQATQATRAAVLEPQELLDIKSTLISARTLTRFFEKGAASAPTLGEIARRMRLSLRRVKQLNKMVAKISSLNAPIGEEGTAEFMDLIEDENMAATSDGLSEFLKKERVAELLESERMTTRERKILSLRFGLKDGVTHTLGDTAKRFRITRERVRQIENAAMKKLRDYIKKQELTTASKQA